ncbi:MAG: DUF1318 domain-containing protein [Kiritimatiellia bacterium]
MMKITKLKFFALFFGAVLVSSAVFADAKSEAHARRKARKNSVTALVEKGAVREGANGYLIPEKDLGKEKMAVVKAENKDRKIGYKAIAEQHNASVEAISKAAGKINRKKARKRK